MSTGNDLEPFSESLNDVFARLGLPDPVLMSQVNSEWETLAGKPWVGRSKPMFVRGQNRMVVPLFLTAWSLLGSLVLGRPSLNSCE